jgi:hypothetical protein
MFSHVGVIGINDLETTVFLKVTLLEQSQGRGKRPFLEAFLNSPGLVAKECLCPSNRDH